ncbi:4'-phosphopantetheinyl transferase superfamily protein (plasmid) [Rhizobium bangladeshense]|uniref:4'-phosphopantetheinyl transferase family protein n=1 Tax=Rhizobium bangladeshense TaxID=1138189 RepID=UPI001A9984AC|nr:4'-phosphopantetheinyl transferase superfamily protein [Rhizobium bangladeshense]QSY96530.1 4'-phosphopantetheinyl transferase superfamily protein [Rhizobium bangladeshense]
MQQSENQLAAINVVLWRYAENDGDQSNWMRTLSPNERERAATYRFDRDRTSFIAGRYLLRRMLSAHAGIQPGEVVLLADEHGRLAFDRLDAPQFSLANAYGLVAVAVASECECVGIDCERADAEIEEAALVTYCSADERRWLDHLPIRERPRAAVALWALKESHLKALGVGLSEDPRNITFSWEDGTPVAAKGGTADQAWHHHLIEGGSQHVIALAVRSQCALPGIRVAMFQDDIIPSE